MLTGHGCRERSENRADHIRFGRDHRKRGIGKERVAGADGINHSVRKAIDGEERAHFVAGSAVSDDAALAEL